MNPVTALAVVLRLAAIVLALYFAPMCIVFLFDAGIGGHITWMRIAMLLGCGVVASCVLWFFSGGIARLLLPAGQHDSGAARCNAQSLAHAGIVVIAVWHLASSVSDLPLLAFFSFSAATEVQSLARDGMTKELLLMTVVPEFLVGILLLIFSGLIVRLTIRGAVEP